MSIDQYNHKISPDKLIKVKSIERGCFGDINLVKDSLSGQHYTANTYKIDIMSNVLNCTEDNSKDIITKKVEAMEKYTNIDEMVRYIDNSIKGNKITIYMEHCNGGTLDNLICKVFPNGLPHQLLYPVIKQIVDAVYKLHQINLFHGDIHPNNIYIFDKKEMVIKLGEISLFSNIENSKSLKSSYYRNGISDFISPEEYKSLKDTDEVHHRLPNTNNKSISNDINHNKNIDNEDNNNLRFKNDIYSLGITLIHLCFGTRKIFYDKFREDIKGIYYYKIIGEYIESCDIPRQLIEMIYGLIQCDYYKRLTIEQILNHQYFAENSVVSIPSSISNKMEDQILPTMQSVGSPTSNYCPPTPQSMVEVTSGLFSRYPRSISFSNLNGTICSEILKCASTGGDKLDIHDMEYIIGSDDFTGLIVEVVTVLTHLTELRFENCNIDDEFMCKLCPRFKYLTKLSALIFYNNFIGDVGVTSLASSLKYITNLYTLALIENSITDIGIFKLADNFKFVTQLKSLYLSNNNIGNRGARKIANNVKYTPNLTLIDLSGNPNIQDNTINPYFSPYPHLTVFAPLGGDQLIQPLSNLSDFTNHNLQQHPCNQYINRSKN